MPYSDPDSLVSVQWLAKHLSAPDIRVVDGSWKMPGATPSAREDYEAAHIPDAVFFDIDEIADGDTTLPHMLPSPEKFSAKVRDLGLGDGNRIIVYDGAGLMSAARVWWTFRVFGHNDAAILDGGLPKWLAEGQPVNSEPPMPRRRHFSAHLNTVLVRDKSQILANLQTRREQILDARPQARFEGTADEPRPGLRRGHIPGSLNLPHASLLDPETKTLLPPERLKALFIGAGLDLGRPVVVSCGSGVTACVLALGLTLIGKKDVAVYDGSWAEWGLPGDWPVETGPSTTRR